MPLWIACGAGILGSVAACLGATIKQGLEDDCSPSSSSSSSSWHRYMMDDQKLAALGWREQVTWREGLERSIGWYCEVSGGGGGVTQQGLYHKQHSPCLAAVLTQQHAAG